MATGKSRVVLGQLRTLFNVGAIRELSDGQLLERFATEQGEAAELAFAALVERHGPMVLRVCRGVLADPHDAQDAFQATFLVLVRRARALWVQDSLGPWLHQVAWRTAMCAKRGAACRRRHERAATTLTPECTAEPFRELEAALHEEIHRLPESFRAPVVLCDLGGRTHEQAARHLGWPIGTVKSRLARARERLREQLRHRGLGPEAGLLAVPGSGSLTGRIPADLLRSTMAASMQAAAGRAFLQGSATSLAQGVLSAMSLSRWFKAAALVLVVGVTAAAVDPVRGTAPGPQQNQPQAPGGNAAVTRASRGPLVVTVTERGVLEAVPVADVFCKIEGNTKIKSIVPERTKVKKGDLVCELDSAELANQRTNQLITIEGAHAAYLNAKLTRELIEKAVAEHNGDARKDEPTKPGELSLAGAERKRGEQPKARPDALQRFKQGKTPQELKNDLEKARSDEQSKQRTWDLERWKLARLEQQIKNCKLVAPRDGSVFHANDPARFGPPRLQIKTGATVRERQKLFSVVDLDGPLRVALKVPEAKVHLVRPGLRALVKVDAFPDESLGGTVEAVAPLPDPSTFFQRDVKVHSTQVSLEMRPPKLQAGMTAEVEIVVAELDNVLSVPFSAVLLREGKSFVAVRRPDGTIDWREVTVGAGDGKRIEIKQGLQSGEAVINDPSTVKSDDPKRQKSAVEKQADEFKLRQAELNDQIRNLTRERDEAKKNSDDLRARTARFNELLRKNGLSGESSSPRAPEKPSGPSK